MFSCEFREISRNTFSTEHHPTTASEKIGVHEERKFFDRYLHSFSEMQLFVLRFQSLCFVFVD